MKCREEYIQCLLYGHKGKPGDDCLKCGYVIPEPHPFYGVGEIDGANWGEMK